MAINCQQQNKTSSLALYSTSECIVWLTMFGMELVAIVTLNVLAIIVFLKEPSLRKPRMYLVINQAVADIFVGGWVILQCRFLGIDCFSWTIFGPSEPFTDVMDIFGDVLPIVSLTNLSAISLERTYATFFPLKHRLVKKKLVGAAVAAVWIATGLSAAITLLTILHPFTDEVSYNLFILYLSFFLLSLLTLLLSYASIARKIICGNQPHQHSATSRERKLTKALFIVTVVSLLLTLPFVIFLILDSVSSHTFTTISLRVWSRFYYFFGFLFGANSLVNPVLYAFRIPEFKRTLLSFLHCRSHAQAV